jgi:hypothetical protein
MSNVLRGVLTAVVLVLWGWLENITSLVSPLVSGPAATLQFQNSDTAYLMSQVGMRFTPMVNGLIDVLALVALVWIWVLCIPWSKGSSDRRSNHRWYCVGYSVAFVGLLCESGLCRGLQDPPKRVGIHDP